MSNKKRVKNMNVNCDQKKVLMDMIEQVLLNEQELDSLKLLINDIHSGKIDQQHLKIAILKSRANAVKQILKLFPFFHNRIISQQEIEKFTTRDNDNNNPELLQELEEKNSFLQQIGLRIHNILEKMNP